MLLSAGLWGATPPAPRRLLPIMHSSVRVSVGQGEIWSEIRVGVLCMGLSWLDSVRGGQRQGRPVGAAGMQPPYLLERSSRASGSKANVSAGRQRDSSSPAQLQLADLQLDWRYRVLRVSRCSWFRTWFFPLSPSPLTLDGLNKETFGAKFMCIIKIKQLLILL